MRADERVKETLTRLSTLIRERNRVATEIAAVIGRPAHPGHLGEFLAAQIFDIALERSATVKGIDGRFRTGALAGHSVNVKFYPCNAGLLDINPTAVPACYLVLAGPWTAAVSSRGTTAPW